MKQNMPKSVDKLITAFFLKLFQIEPFKSRLALLQGKAGIVTDTRPCGCILKGEHQPDKHLWIFTYDYSNCNLMKGTMRDLQEVLP